MKLLILITVLLSLTSCNNDQDSSEIKTVSVTAMARLIPYCNILEVPDNLYSDCYNDKVTIVNRSLSMGSNETDIINEMISRLNTIDLNNGGDIYDIIYLDNY